MAIISKFFEKSGWSTLQAHDVQSGLTAVADNPVDLMLLDVFVGAQNTLDHLQWFRSSAPNIPIAVMSAGQMNGASAAETLSAARQAQVEFVLQKPFGIETIAPVLAEAEAARRRNRRAVRVLVVEDSRSIRAIVGRALAEDGFIVSEADDMEDALVRVDIARIDIVITDIFMPGMGGIEGIKVIRKNWPNVGIIAMSAGLRDKIRAFDVLTAAGRMGATELLEKPFTPEKLIGAVNALLRKMNAPPPPNPAVLLEA